MTGLPPDILISNEIKNLPPRECYLSLTIDQQNFWLSQKYYWTEIYAALTRFHCGFPIVNRDWPKPIKEKMMADLSYYSSLYQLINFGWYDLMKRLPEYLEDPENLPKKPGELFILLLKHRAIGSLLPCIEGYSFSPRARYKAEIKLIRGEVEPWASDGQRLIMQLEKKIFSILNKSRDFETKSALDNCLNAAGNIRRIRMKAVHPSRGFISGGQWIDGSWLPSRKGVRHHPNLPEE
jgi:hypothetical protein